MLNHIPIRLDYYLWCAETWIEIFNKLNISSFNTIIDVCPGWSPKIELALLKSNFKGEVIAVDKSKENLEYFSYLLNPIQKKYYIRLKQYDFVRKRKFSYFKNIKGDLVIANHIIDDILIDYYLSSLDKKHENIFESAKYFKKIWEEILSQEELHLDVVNLLSEFFLSVVGNKGYIIITQYKGYQEKLYDLQKVAELNMYLMSEIKAKLIHTKKFVDKHQIVSAALNNIKDPYFLKEATVCLRKI